MTGKEFSQTMDERDRFEKLAKAVWPLMVQMEKLISESGFKKAADIIIDTDGYAKFTTYDTSWELVRYRTNDKPKLHLDYSHTIDMEV